MAPVREHSAKSGVKFARLRSVRNQVDICGADSCARHNNDPVPSGFDKSGEDCSPLQRALRAAGRQDSLRAALDYIFEGLAQIGSLVERAVIRHPHRLRKFN